MYCPQCGTENKDDARFCEQCGTPLTPRPQSPAPPQTAAQPGQAPSPAAAGGPADGAPAGDGQHGPRKTAILVAVAVVAAAVISFAITVLVMGNHHAGSDGSASSQASDARTEGSGSADGDAGSAEGSGDDGSTASSLTDEQKMDIAYGNVLDQVANLEFSEDATRWQSNGYSYALVDMTGTGTPSLIVIDRYNYDYKVEMYNGLVFTYDPDSGQAQPNTGVDLIWGYRVNGGVDASGVGLTTSQPSDANHTVRYVVQDGSLVAQDGAGSLGADITMYDLSDRSALGGATNGTLPGLAPTDLEAAKAQAEADGLVVYQGTGRILSGNDLMQITVGYDAFPNKDSTGVIDRMLNANYAVLIFDQDTEVTCAMSGDPGMDTRKTMLINLGTDYVAQMQAYDGKPVTVAIDPERTCWPSEVTVAGGCPGVIKNARVLG